MYSKEELKSLKKEFWEGFDCFCENMNGCRKKWILYDTKTPGLTLKFDATRTGAYVIMEVNHRHQSEREATFQKLQAYKVVVEAPFDSPLVWNANAEAGGGRMCAQVYVVKNGIDFHRRIQWMDFYKFFYENMTKMEEAFEDIKDLIKD